MCDEFQGVLNRVPVLTRDASLSDSCTVIADFSVWDLSIFNLSNNKNWANIYKQRNLLGSCQSKLKLDHDYTSGISYKNDMLTLPPQPLNIGEIEFLAPKDPQCSETYA